MTSGTKISGELRRAAIIEAAQKVFVEKGFHRTTTRELAAAAGVSEALLFKHFPGKEALYEAILMSGFKEERARIAQRLQSLEPSTAALVVLVHDSVSLIVGDQPDEGDRAVLRLILRSLMDEGEFARASIQGVPQEWVEKVATCIQAAQAAGDLIDQPAQPKLRGWFVHQLVSGMMLHSLPASSLIDYEVPRGELTKQVVWFCLRGIGLKEDAIRRCWPDQGLNS